MRFPLIILFWAFTVMVSAQATNDTYRIEYRTKLEVAFDSTIWTGEIIYKEEYQNYNYFCPTFNDIPYQYEWYYLNQNYYFNERKYRRPY